MSIRTLYAKLCGGENLTSFHTTVARTMFIQLFLLVITTVVSILISRKLGVEGRGAASWMINFILGGSICMALGMGTASKKHLAKNPVQASVFAWANAALLLISSACFLPLFYYYGGLSPVPEREHPAFLLALLACPLLAFSIIANEMILGLGRNLHSNVLLIVEKCTTALFNGLLLVSGHVFTLAVVGAYVAGIISRVILSLRFLAQHIHTPPSCGEIWRALRQMRRLLFSSYISSLAGYYCGLFLLITLGVMASADQLGYFAAAKIIIDNLLMLFWTFSSFVVPQLAKQKTPKTYAKMKWHIIGLVCFLMLLAALPLFIYSREVIALLFGTHFMEAGECLHIIVIGMALNGIMSAFNAIIASQAKEHLFMLAPLTTAAFMTVLTWRFYDGLDAFTAAYIYTIAYIAGLTVSIIPAFYARFTPDEKKAYTS